MDVLNLAQEIIHGKRLTREDDLSFFLTCDLEPLCQGATRSERPVSATRSTSARSSTVAAAAVRRTANTARSPRTITRNATFTTFSLKRRS